MKNPALDRHARGFRAVGDFQLLHDVFQMPLRRGFRTANRFANLPVAQAFADQFQHLAFALGQRRARTALLQASGECRRKIILTSVNGADGAQQFLQLRRLGEIARRAGLHGAVNILLAFINRKHQDAGVRKFAAQRGQRFHAAHAGQPAIHDDHVGLVLAKHFQRLRAIVRLRHHVDVRLGIERTGQTHADEKVIVHDQQTNAGFFHVVEWVFRGTVTETTVPAPTLLSIFKRP